MFLAPSLNRIKPSPTLMLSAQAKALRAEGVDIIDLSAGEPDICPPASVLKAAHQAIEDEYHYYTPVDGLATLKEAIIQKLRREQNSIYTPSEIVASAGAKSLIFHAFLVTLSEKDEVIIPTPAWVSYQDMVLFTGAKPLLIPCPASHTFKLSASALRRALSSRTKWLILNSPNNPSGSVYTETELLALAEVLREYPHVHVLSDDIYEAFVYDEQPFKTLGQIAPFLKDRILMINGVSKAYAMTGWRIGYGAGPSVLMRAIATLQSQSTSNPCAVAQKAAEAALLDSTSWLHDTRLLFEKRRNVLIEAMRPIRALTFEKPAGAFYAYLNCETLLNHTTPDGKCLTTDTEIAAYFLKEAQVCVVPGSAFGLSPYLRLSYAIAPEFLIQAAERLHKAINLLCPP